jgi:predicted phage terminase large subunit-like protein
LITLLRSDWYLERWGNLCPKGNLALANFSNLLGGFRFSTSVAGKVTGRHADIQIVDDPIKPRDASGGVNHSRTALEAVSSWWRQTMASRARDPRSFRRVVIMQRLHEDDLAGECIRAGYTLLRLPMRYEEDEPCRTAWGGDRRTEPGALLCPDRYPEEAVRRLEVEEMGPDVAAAQLQQRPTRRGGGIFRRDWWRYWHPDDQDRGQPLPPEGHGIQIQSWDLTFKGSDGSDFVCGGVWWAARGQYLLMDLICERMTFTQTLDAMRHMTAKWPRAHDKLVEDKANGPAVEDALRREIRGITLVSPEGGKEARAHACTPAFASGRVLIPHPSLAGWVKAYQAQHEAFPRSAHDDMVDMTSQALGRLRRHGEDFSRAMARVRGEDT